MPSPLSLHDQRLATVLSVLRDTGGKRIIDLGCGESRFVQTVAERLNFLREGLIETDMGHLIQTEKAFPHQVICGCCLL